MKFNDALSGLALLALSVAILFDIRTFPDFPGQKVGPGAFPGLLAVLLAGCAIALIWRGWRDRAEQGVVAVGAWLHSPRHVLNFCVAVGGLLFYIVASEKLGFLICGTVILLALFLALRVKPLLAVPLSIVFPIVIHLIFYKTLRVPLPWGVLPVLW
ncbi:MAG: tripartite tricarboxylate transporter TctB family protein [Betaproteobacteria bacterium]|nr:tripartite tricarboxylate transporter TctB family protein [Betaproteobacteria bacterium]